MAKERRARSFLLEPGRYRTDPAVLSMSLEARGAYSGLFMQGWDMPEPGVFPDDDRVLAQLAGATPEEWARVRSEVARAFDVENRPGFWVQKGLVRTKESQDRFIAAQSRKGRASAKKRWGNEKGNRPITGEITDPQPTSVLGSRFSVLPRPSASEVAPPSLRSEVAPQAAPEVAPRDRKSEARAAVLDRARSMSAVAPTFPADVAWDWITATLKPTAPREAMKLMGWLWKSGTHDLEAIQRMVLEVRDGNIRDPYAYFAKDGDARSCRQDAVSIDREAEAMARQNAEDAAWLAKR